VEICAYSRNRVYYPRLNHEIKKHSQAGPTANPTAAKLFNIVAWLREHRTVQLSAAA
jgi:hypothetical protein